MTAPAQLLLLPTPALRAALAARGWALAVDPDEVMHDD